MPYKRVIYMGVLQMGIYVMGIIMEMDISITGLISLLQGLNCVN